MTFSKGSYNCSLFRFPGAAAELHRQSLHVMMKKFIYHSVFWENMFLSNVYHSSSFLRNSYFNQTMLFKSQFYVHKKLSNKYLFLPIPLFVHLRQKTRTVDMLHIFLTCMENSVNIDMWLSS